MTDQPDMSDEQQVWLEIMVANELPVEIASQVLDGNTTPNFGSKLNRRAVWVFVIFMIISVLIVLPFEAGECGRAGAVNFTVSMIILLLASICAAAVFLNARAQSVSREKKQAIFLWFFVDKGNRPLSNFFAKRAKQMEPHTAEFDRFYELFFRLAASWFKWPMVILLGLSVMSYLFLPDTCLNG